MKRAIILLCSTLVLGQAAASAAEIGQCNGLDRVSFLVGQTRSFSGGKIKIAHIDTDGEPVCCSSHLVVIIPADPTGSQCFALSEKAATDAEGSPRGFSSIAFNKISAAYDSSRGLLLTVPYTLYNDGKPGRPGSAKVRVNLRADGAVAIER